MSKRHHDGWDGPRSEFLSISYSVQAPEYEVQPKTCRRCGAKWEGHVWTKPPVKCCRTVFVFEGRALGWCGPCIDRRERELKASEARPKRPEVDLKPPMNAGDAWEPWERD